MYQAGGLMPVWKLRDDKSIGTITRHNTGLGPDYNNSR